MTLTDTGPLVALLDRKDPNHVPCRKALRKLRAEPLLTTWPCLTEAIYLLGKVGGFQYQAQLWNLRGAGRLALRELTDSDADRMSALMAQYQNVPMDLADASLVAIAESLSLAQVFTLDSDFYIYRLASGSSLDVVP